MHGEHYMLWFIWTVHLQHKFSHCRASAGGGMDEQGGGYMELDEYDLCRENKQNVWEALETSRISPCMDF